MEDVETPIPTGDQVLVRVHASSINRADLDGLYPRWQFTRAFTGLRRPRSRRVGLDVAGTVETVGPEVTTLRPGDRVFGDLSAFGEGAFAELACAPERAFAPMPAGLTFPEAATLPNAGILAIQGLRRRDGRTFEPGARVLVEGASGSTGTFAVQIAKSMGAHVTGIAHSDNVEFVRSLGADEVVDYRSLDYTRAPQRYDWIFAADAHHGLLASSRALAPGGTYAALGASTAWMLRSLVVTPAVGLARRRRVGLFFWWKPFHPPDVERLRQLVESGAVRPRIDRTYSLDDVVEALRYVDTGHPRGKVVLTIGSPAS